jgi:transposase-like protein
MPYQFDKIPINNPKHDKRVKLSPEDKENIVSDYQTGLFSQRDLAKKYDVSRRLIQFTLDPQKKEIAKQQFSERQKDGRYYNKEKHNEYMKKHRDHKKELWNNGFLNE